MTAVTIIRIGRPQVRNAIDSTYQEDPAAVTRVGRRG